MGGSVLAGQLLRIPTEAGWLAKLGALASADYTASDVLAKLLTVDGSGSGLDADTVDGLQVAAGDYTPTGTGVTNVDSVTPGEAQYIRIGSIVFVSFYVAVDATLAASTSTTFGLSLPVASAFSSARQLSGVGTTAGIWNTVDIEADTTNDRASLRYESPTTGSIAITGVFGYRIL